MSSTIPKGAQVLGWYRLFFLDSRAISKTNSPRIQEQFERPNPCSGTALDSSNSGIAEREAVPEGCEVRKGREGAETAAISTQILKTIQHLHAFQLLYLIL